MSTYDLATRPWLACKLPDGADQQYGLIDLLANAHGIRELAEPSPLGEFGAYRMLIALLHWLRPIKTIAAWRSLWQAGRFPDSLVEGFAWRAQERFDLFHATRPFYQHPRDAKGAKPMTVGYLAMEMPTATYINHFHHVYDSEHAFCPACCAKGLLALSAFATQGGSGKPMSINGPPPLYALPRGDTLFQTLLLNLPIAELTDVWGTPVSGDAPAWDRQEGHGRGSHPVGFLEGLTWQPRRAHLLPEEEAGRCTCCGEDTPVVVREMRFPKGGDSRGPKDTARPWSDPHVPLKALEGDQVRPRAAPAFWCQQLKSLLVSEDVDDIHPPPVMRQTVSLLQMGAMPASATIRPQHLALEAQKATLRRWLRKQWYLPAPVLGDRDACAALRRELDLVEELGAQAVRGLPWAEGRQALWGFHARAEKALCAILAETAAPRLPGALEDYRTQAREEALTVAARRRPRRPVRDRWRRGIARAAAERRLDKAIVEGGES